MSETMSEQERKREFGLSFGALADPISRQLSAQGIQPPSASYHFQRDADAITRLAVRGILSDAEKRRAHQRLMKRITQAIVRATPSEETP